MERVKSILIVATCVGGVSAVVNGLGAVALGRFTNLTPSVKGALAAAGVTAISTLGYGVVAPIKKIEDACSSLKKDTKKLIMAFSIFVTIFAFPVIANAVLTSNFSRVFPSCDVTWKEGLSYGYINGIVAIPVMFYLGSTADKVLGF